MNFEPEKIVEQHFIISKNIFGLIILSPYPRNKKELVNELIAIICNYYQLSYTHMFLKHM